MSQVITAMYEDGVLRPLMPLELPDHTEVRLRLETVLEPPEVRAHRREVDRALIAAGLMLPRATDLHRSPPSPMPSATPWAAASRRGALCQRSSWRSAPSADGHVLCRQQRARQAPCPRDRHAFAHRPAYRSGTYRRAISSCDSSGDDSLE